MISGYGLLFLSMLLTIYAYSGMEYKNGPVIESLGNVMVLVLGVFCLRRADQCPEDGGNRVYYGRDRGVPYITAQSVIPEFTLCYFEKNVEQRCRFCYNWYVRSCKKMKVLT